MRMLLPVPWSVLTITTVAAIPEETGLNQTKNWSWKKNAATVAVFVDPVLDVVVAVAHVRYSWMFLELCSIFRLFVLALGVPDSRDLYVHKENQILVL